MSAETNTVVVLLDRFGVAVLLLIAIAVGVWKAGPRIGAFLSALTEELKALTRAIGTMTERHTEHHAVTTQKIDAMGQRFDARMDLMEARVEGHVTALAGEVARDVSGSVERTGEHAALTALQAVGRQPTNPDLLSVSGDRPSPTPAGFVRATPPRPPSQPGRPPLLEASPRHPSRPSWGRHDKQGGE